MGEIALRRFFLAVICALALSLSALAADAELPSLEAAVNVREDGVCEVTMTAEVDFSAAQDSLLIPLGTDARDITLAGWSYETVLQDGVTCLKLSNPAGFSGKQQLTCSYTLPCRAAEAAVLVSQYSVMLSRTWSLVRLPEGWPSRKAAEIFS